MVFANFPTLFLESQWVRDLTLWNVSKNLVAYKVGFVAWIFYKNTSPFSIAIFATFSLDYSTSHNRTLKITQITVHYTPRVHVIAS